ncbi:MAG: DUF368 domain-containing protein [Lentisphaerae bacterium]|nr:DUF368 domain-containing protein [Lentisphaerota bacterium]
MAVKPTGTIDLWRMHRNRRLTAGGTMAFIMGVYEELLEAIRSFNLQLVQLVLRGRIRAAFEHVPWRFLLPLGIGLLGALFTLAGVISWLLTNQPVLLYAFFFGLVAASIVSVSVHVRWNLSMLVALLAGAVVAWLIIGLVPHQMPHTPLYLFGSGAVAIMAMILPGISGSFILLILGQYAYVLEQVKNFNLPALVPLVAGIVVGLLAFVRILSWLLRHYHQVTVTLLVGFMLGSLRKIWPFKETLETMVNRHGELVPIREANVLPPWDATLWMALGLALAGFVLITLLDHLQTRANPMVLFFARLMRRKV